MRFRGEAVDYLFIERHSAAESLRFGQQAIIEPTTAPQPATIGRETYPGYDHEVQLVPVDEWRGVRGLGNPESADGQRDLRAPGTCGPGSIAACFRLKAREGDRLSFLRCDFPQRQNIRFGRLGVEEEYPASLPPLGQLAEAPADCC